jgi:hypothetical protein
MLDDLMAGIREVGEAFMEDDAIEVYRYSENTRTWEEDLAEQYDYGDDEVDFVEPELHTEAFVDRFPAWVVTKLDYQVQTNGAMVLVNDHVIRVPVGSDIRPRDIVILQSSGERRVVFKTNAEDTHPEWMKVYSRGGE